MSLSCCNISNECYTFWGEKNYYSVMSSNLLHSGKNTEIFFQPIKYLKEPASCNPGYPSLCSFFHLPRYSSVFKYCM